MSDSDSSEDELGLFSFKNKKTISARAPVLATREAQTSEPSFVDKAMFRKRKRETGPVLETGDSLDDSLTLLDYKEIEDDFVEEKPSVPEQPETVRIDILEEPDILEPVKKTKKFQKCANDRAQLSSNLDSMLYTFKMKQGAFRGNIPQVEAPEPPPVEVAETRKFVVKFRKGGSLHRFKLQVDQPISIVLPHLAAEYNTEPSLILLQLNDVQLDVNSTPEKLGITITDFIEVLINARTEPAPVPTMKIKIQSIGHRNNCKEYAVIKSKPLREYFFQATKDFGFGAARFRFDGESVKPSMTPEELDMEEGDCIDIESVETEPAPRQE